MMKTIELMTVVHFAGLVLGLFGFLADIHSVAMYSVIAFLIGGNLTGLVYCTLISIKEERDWIQEILSVGIAEQLGLPRDRP